MSNHTGPVQPGPASNPRILVDPLLVLITFRGCPQSISLGQPSYSRG